MWVARHLFVGCVAALVLAAMQNWAMGETIEKEAKVHFLGTKPRPLERLVWCSPEEEFRAAVDRLLEERGREVVWRMLMGEAHRAKAFTGEG